MNNQSVEFERKREADMFALFLMLTGGHKCSG